MTVIFTAGARADLEEIQAYTRQHYPAQLPELEKRISAVIARIERRPKSAPLASGYPGVGTVLLLRYPFKIFYREISGGVQILYIRHTSRSAP
ncbi:MAG: type II toxin-antitoxin system RelE/ParE family toxin [Rhizomicrobium sp.]